VPCSLAEVTIFAETAKVIEGCLSASCDGNNMIDVKNYTKMGGRTTTTVHASKTSTLQDRVASPEPDLPSVTFQDHSFLQNG
jgi:hypothetical protein